MNVKDFVSSAVSGVVQGIEAARGEAQRSTPHGTGNITFNLYLDEAGDVASTAGSPALITFTVELDR